MGSFPAYSLHGEDDQTMAEGRVKANEEGGRASVQQWVPNREGKAKSQWTVATVHEEAPGERTVATEVTH